MVEALREHPGLETIDRPASVSGHVKDSICHRFADGLPPVLCLDQRRLEFGDRLGGGAPVSTSDVRVLGLSAGPVEPILGGREVARSRAFGRVTPAARTGMQCPVVVLEFDEVVACGQRRGHSQIRNGAPSRQWEERVGCDAT